MYHSCLFCHSDLGRNDALESLPIGRRVAFDPARGRLWVVCTRCGRWNLTPFEERWETLEECERLFRGTRLRYATDNIGLAQPDWGFELVRVGPALMPELAAWRYGSTLLKRATSFAGYARNLGASRKTVMRIRTLPRRHDALARIHYDGISSAVRYAHLPHAELLRPEQDGAWRLRVRHDLGTAVLEGSGAISTARKLLTALNDGSAPETLVRAALAKLDTAAETQNYFGRISALAIITSWGRVPAPQGRGAALELAYPGKSVAEQLILRLTTRSFWSRGGTGSEDRTLLHWIPDVDRLALEMAANEDAERQALEGELAALEEAWREAEEIAAIADHLLDDERLA